MAARKALDINPVFTHRKSIALVDTAEELVDSLDSLSVCLRHIEEKYVKNEKEKKTHDAQEEDRTGSLYEKLKENLEVARDLTDILKREKWRLSRREMSVELRMGELEEYKSHLKRDMTDMNETVDVLSVRVVQLENALCEAQETQENLEADIEGLKREVEVGNTTITALEEKEKSLKNEIQKLKSERKDSVMRQQFQDLTDKVEILMLENHRLKDIIREKEDELASVTSARGNINTSQLTKDDGSENNVDKKERVKCEGHVDTRKEDKKSVSTFSGITETSEIAYV